MGLDAVELIMRAEEEFDIEILDEEASLVSTPGQLCALIERKLGTVAVEKRSGCPTSRAFYRVRRELVALGVERRKISPTARFEALVPYSKRQIYWRGLGEGLGVTLPPLMRSSGLVVVSFLPVGILPFCVIFSPATGAALCLAYALLLPIGFRVTRPLAVHPLYDLRSVGDLARRVAWKTDDVPPREREVWPAVQQIVAEVAGVPLEKVTRDVDIVRELGMG